MTSDDIAPEDSSSKSTQVDQQDGGPGSHSEDGSGGDTNDVASGGTGDGSDREDGIETDVHGDIDTVS